MNSVELLDQHSTSKAGKQEVKQFKMKRAFLNQRETPFYTILHHPFIIFSFKTVSCIHYCNICYYETLISSHSVTENNNTDHNTPPDSCFYTVTVVLVQKKGSRNTNVCVIINIKDQSEDRNPDRRCQIWNESLGSSWIGFPGHLELTLWVLVASSRC